MATPSSESIARTGLVQRTKSSVDESSGQVAKHDSTATSLSPSNGVSNGIRDNKPKRRRGQPTAVKQSDAGLWSDIKTGRWMLVPSSALTLWLVPVVYHLNHILLVRLGWISPNAINLAEPLLFLQGRQADGRYSKEWSDVLFVGHQIIWWSFVRQFMTIHVLRPIAGWFNIKGGKVERFTEQAYGLFYWGLFGVSGIVVMSGLPSWWYRTDQFFADYPHKLIPFGLKAVYLLQASYWLQQMIILIAGIEKPRKDFKLLAAHHIVTLYLIIGSYCMYFTHIGVAVFVTMDVSDIFFCLAKCTNYVDESASVPVFAVFIGVWTYFRHYLNLRMLWSIWNEFDLIPYRERQLWAPSQDKWCAPWIKLQVFIPMFLLQLMNLFWYFLIIRILIRTLCNVPLKDERSDDEDEGEEVVDEVVGEVEAPDDAARKGE